MRFPRTNKFLSGVIIAIALFAVAGKNVLAASTYQKLIDQNYVILQVPIPFPGCGTSLTDKVLCCGDEDVKNYYVAKNSIRTGYGQAPLICPAGSVAAIKDIPALVVVGVEFMSIVLIVMMVLILMIAGVQYITSQGNPEKAEASIKKVKQAVAGLVIVLFSSVILFQINPALTNLSLKSATTINSTPEAVQSDSQTCKPNKDEASCTKAGCKWTGIECAGADTFSCGNIVGKDRCLQSNCDYVNNICIAKRALDVCVPTEQTAISCSTQIGCSWDVGCQSTQQNLDKMQKDKITVDTCQLQKTKDKCDQFPTWCEWRKGCMLDKFLITRVCSDYTSKDECPTTNCYWESAGLFTSAGTCKPAIQVGYACDVNKQEQCGSNAFCRAIQPGDSSPKCVEKLRNDVKCAGMIDPYDYTLNGNACISGLCSSDGTCQ